LAGGIAHDFNNLLQTVQGYSELLLLGKEESEPVHKGLQEIIRAAKRGAVLIRQLLTFSRKEKSKRRPVVLNLEVATVKELLERTIPKRVEFELQLADDPRKVNADPIQIEQVIVNLALNATDAMPEGGKLTIATENVILGEEYCQKYLEVKPGNYVLLTVSDTGHGMDGETREHIFDPFYTTKEVGRGTGLGLAMVYGIVKSHEGYITCSSRPGEGTTFKIYLPAIVDEGETIEEEEAETPVD
jgi:signal transduction histidine kinase